MRYLFIVNRLSNVAYLNKLEDAIASISDNNLRLRIEIRYTEYHTHAHDIALECSQKFGSEVAIVVCGGDGMVHEVANALLHTSTPMIIIPLGSDNDFSRSVFPFKARTDYKYLITHLDDLVIRTVDVIRYDSYDVLGTQLSNWSGYANNIMSIGLDAIVQSRIKKVINGRKVVLNNKTAYFGAALRAVLSSRKTYFDYQLELANGEIYESKGGKHTLMCICNGRHYGNGFTPAPTAYIDDGLIDVCVIDAKNMFSTLWLLWKYRKGSHVKCNDVKMFKCKSGTITSMGSSFQIFGNVDGEDFYAHRMRFEVFPKVLNVGVDDDCNLLCATDKESSIGKKSSGRKNTHELNGGDKGEQINRSILDTADMIELVNQLEESLSANWDMDYVNSGKQNDLDNLNVNKDLTNNSEIEEMELKLFNDGITVDLKLSDAYEKTINGDKRE